MHCWLLARKSPSPQQQQRRRRRRSEEEGVFSFQYNSRQYNPQYNPHTGQKSSITEFRTSWGGLVSRLLPSVYEKRVYVGAPVTEASAVTGQLPVAVKAQDSVPSETCR
jgi:hypothetical protein